VEYPDVQVIVADQSTTDDSQRVIAAELDPRLVSLRLHSVGKGRALNTALSKATGEIIVFTDDDCTVPRGWVQRAVRVLAREPRAGIVFGTLAAAPHDSTAAFVPTFWPRRYRQLRARTVAAHYNGMGANMAVRRTVFERVGCFDTSLGPGSRFRSADETDLAHRALRAGFTVVQDPDNVVLHWGAREYASGAARRSIADGFYAVGACYARHVRRRDWAAAVILAREAALLAGQAGLNTVRRRPTGLRRLLALAHGAVDGLRYPIEEPARSRLQPSIS
jgi:GT2 family glycosyltransferase